MIENIRLSFQGIFSHKLRSFLTMLGIIIGIAAIIAIVSTIKGTNDQIKANLVGQGNNLVNVKLMQSDWEVSAVVAARQGIPVIDDSIMDEILAIKEVSAATYYHKLNMYDPVKYKTNSVDGVTIYGVKDGFLEINDNEIVSGRGFVEKDAKEFRKVVILDRDAERALFQGESGVNKTIEIKGAPYTVIGICEEKNAFSPTVENLSDWYTYYGQNSMGKIIVNDAIWPAIVGFDLPYDVIVKAVDTDSMSEAGKKTADLLNNYINSANSANTANTANNGNNTNNSDSGDVSGETELQIKYKSDDILEKARQLQELSNSTNKQLIWIAGISLIVGGIGVMNIMLVSVTERTREIGLKKALGARRGIVLGQFLTEAAVLTSMGGILGVGVGVGLAYLIGKIAEVPVAISVPAICVSVLFSMVIGVVFGLIPSIKASKLNPIDALRYE